MITLMITLNEFFLNLRINIQIYFCQEFTNNLKLSLSFKNISVGFFKYKCFVINAYKDTHGNIFF